jgi:hypothetical protein
MKVSGSRSTFERDSPAPLFQNLSAKRFVRSMKISGQPPASYDGRGWNLEGSGRLAGLHHLCSPATKRKAFWENCLLKSVLIDSHILVEVSRARDDVILARWKDLSQSVNPSLAALSTLFEAIDCVPIDLRIGQSAGGYPRQCPESRCWAWRCADRGHRCSSQTRSLDPESSPLPMKAIAFY